MKKDNIRDYATEAFRHYAACGCRTSDEIREQLYQRTFEQAKKDYSAFTKNKSYSSSVEYAVMIAEQTIEQHKAEILDILAVEMTMKELKCGSLNYNLRHIKQAVEIVYFTNPDKELKRNDISDRVHMAEREILASESQVYRWLRRARIMFAQNRGLRVLKVDSSRG